MVTALHRMLYDRLKAKFGSVRISNAGQAMIAVDGDDVFAEYGEEPKPHLDIIQPGEYYLVNCFAPETMVATQQGDREIKDLVGVARLLIPNKTGLGNWQDVEVRHFGKQKLLSVTLAKKGAVKVIRATADHRWVTSGRIGLYGYKTTSELSPGDKLAGCFRRNLASYGTKQPLLSAAGVTQGFVFGDGSHAEAGREAARLMIYSRGKDAALLPYFAGHRVVDRVRDGKSYKQVCDLPRFWKRLPPYDESFSFLLGWLAGYFAADGHVSANGKQATLFSASVENLQFVKGVCYQLGIRVSPIRLRPRTSEGCVAGAKELELYGVSFSVSDVPAYFWLQRHHRERAEKWSARAAGKKLKTNWRVVKVEDLGEEDDVYCAVVPGVEKFTLADNLLTMNCPFCNDTRHRLYVSHRFGSKSDQGRVLNFLAVCYNEGCMKKEENREEFREIFKVLDGELERAKILKGSTVPPHLRTADWPGHCKRLDVLKEDHKARLYVRSRKFDPDRLGRVYHVSYCDDSFYGLARNRLVIPVYWRDRLVGWQTRHVGELDWKNPAKKDTLPPKYWTMPGMPRGTILANIHNARLFSTGVLVEGWFDVFGFGPMAMPVLGNTISEQQKRLFATVFNKPDHSGVLLLDPEEFNSMTTQRAIRVLRDKFTRGTFAAVKLPKGTDPGKLDRQFLRDYVREQAEEQGVEVSWDRIA